MVRLNGDVDQVIAKRIRGITTRRNCTLTPRSGVVAGTVGAAGVKTNQEFGDLGSLCALTWLSPSPRLNGCL